MSDVLGKESREYYNKDISNSYNRSGAFKKIQSGMTLDALSIIHFSKGTILDLGCGTGFSTQVIKKEYNVVGMDNNLDMILHAKNKKINKLVVADFEHLPFKDNSFIGIISISSIQWLKKYERLVRELRRVLMNNGKIILQYYPNSPEEKKTLIKQAIKQGFRINTQTVGTGRKKKEYTILY